MKHSQKEDGGILAIISGVVALILLLLWIFLTWNLYSSNIESLETENDKQWDYYRTLSGAIDIQNKKVDDAVYLIKRIDEQAQTIFDNIELANQSKIYDLEITICKMDKDNNEIDKRTITMKNVVGINPSVERTANVIDTGLWYGSSVEIPTIMDDEEEYACGLNIISVR